MTTPSLLPDADLLPVLDDWHALLVSGVPLLDARAPVEFAEGALPTATNLPLMDDADRDAIGKRYKHAGQDVAIELRLKLVSGDLKAQRIAAWEQFVREHPQGALYCFRGGLRSRITQQWLYTHTGIAYPRVQGGYKAMRRYLLEQLETLPTRYQNYVLSGRTGSGKTRFLSSFRQQVDLEGLANHRGSAFGPQVTPQPNQASFENALAVRLLQQLAAGHRALLFEDESRNIGSVHLPDALFLALRAAPLVMLQTPDEERVQISYQEYVVDMTAAFARLYGEDGFAAFSAYLLGSLAKVQKRLGGVRYAHVLGLMQAALAGQARTGDTEAHLDWVRFILLEYYDPMYDYQISKKQERLVFAGNAPEVREYLASCAVC